MTSRKRDKTQQALTASMDEARDWAWGHLHGPDHLPGPLTESPPADYTAEPS